MRCFVGVFAILLSIGAPDARAAEPDSLAPLTIEPGRVVEATIEHEERFWTFAYRIPKGFDPEAKHPLILWFGGNGEPLAGVAAEAADMEPKADADGTVLVYPALGYAGPADVFSANLAFVARLLDVVAGQIDIDADRVYSTGTSAGGLTAFLLACENPQRFAAIASSLATSYVSVLGRCLPDPLPVMIVSATADPLMPFEGQGLTVEGWPDRVLSAEEYVAYWKGRNGITSAPAESAIEDRVTEILKGSPVSSHIVRYSWSGPSGNDLIWLKVVNGGHFPPQWNDGKALDSSNIGPGIDLSANGTINSDYSSAGAIYDFFLAHGRKDHP